MTIAEYVQNGIKLLDEKGPENWRELIELDPLDIQFTNHCIIGQLARSNTSHYSALLNKLDVEHPEEYGFDEVDGEYDVLTHEWRLALSA